MILMHTLSCITRDFKLLAGDADAVARVRGRMDVNYLDNWTSKDNLRLLNLL